MGEAMLIDVIVVWAFAESLRRETLRGMEYINNIVCRDFDGYAF